MRRHACAKGSDSNEASSGPMASPRRSRSFRTACAIVRMELPRGEECAGYTKGCNQNPEQMHKGDPITPEALAAELDRICESPAFRHSLRHQQFLRHLVACKLAGQLAALREIALGIDFFGRSASTYDPKTDAVVRVEAGRLRQRLDRYYHGEGIDAPFEISLDKGSYLPIFRVRAPAAVTIG